MERNADIGRQPRRERAVQKQITFDLSDRKLQSYYPRPDSSEDANYYKKAWRDIAGFMQKNGFEHRQYSVYASIQPMTRAAVLVLTDRMVEKMLWLRSCLNAIDVTDIGRQHSLMQAVENSAIRLESPVPMPDEKNGNEGTDS